LSKTDDGDGVSAGIAGLAPLEDANNRSLSVQDFNTPNTNITPVHHQQAATSRIDNVSEFDHKRGSTGEKHVEHSPGSNSAAISAKKENM